MNNMSLTKRVTIDVLVAIIVSTMALGVFSYLMVRSKIINESATRALAVAQSVSAALDASQYTEIMSTGKTNAYYENYKAFLDDVFDRTGAVYLYIIDRGYGADVTYFAEGYPYVPRQDEPPFVLGDTEDADDFSDEMFETLKTGTDSTTGVYDLGGYGKMVSGFSAIKDGSGRVLGVVGVDITIDEALVSANSFGLYMAILAVILCALVAAVIVFAIKNVFRNLRHMAGALDQIGEKGDLAFPPEVIESAKTCSAWNNEIGLCARAFSSMLSRLTYLEEALMKVTAGNLRIDVEVLSDGDDMGKAIEGTVAKLNEVFSKARAGITQVSDGSVQIADGAQSLAQGSAQQSATVEELSASIAEIANRTKSNAEMADEASALASTILNDAEKGTRQMDEMIAAVGEINESSKNIGKIIKTIDDIAFQTNILALNAAVEAARAGQHGKGFAVVAEEVRNLATKSAQAAKDTGDMIQSSMVKAELGAHIAEKTAASFSEIVSGIGESSQLVMSIAQSSEVQSKDIEQINNGISQVSHVVHQNSATAEESAAASGDMSARAHALQELISQFHLKGA